MKICYYQLESVDSTNSWAKSHLEAFEVDALTVITTDRQTAGRGRWGREWVSPAGKNVCMSLVLSTAAPPFCLSQLTTIVLQKLMQAQFINAKIKWPNDLLVDGAKISGILLERIDDWTVIGIGLNVNMNDEELKNVSQKATSMAQAVGHEFEVQQIVKELVQLFVTEYENALRNNFEEVVRAWHEKVQWMIAEPVTVQTPSGRLQGRLKALTTDGRVEVQLVSGEIVNVQSADALQLPS